MFISWGIIVLIVVAYFWADSKNSRRIQQLAEDKSNLEFRVQQLREECEGLYKKVDRAHDALYNVQDHLSALSCKDPIEYNDVVDVQLAMNEAISYFDDDSAGPDEAKYRLKKPQ